MTYYHYYHHHHYYYHYHYHHHHHVSYSILQIIGLVVAESHDEAVYAARQVVIKYEDLPTIISIQDAIAADCFYPNVMEIVSGDVEALAAEADVIVEGEVSIGGQEHFYLETNCCLVVPSENDSLEVFSSTQNANETQVLCAHVCGLPASNVVCKIKR
jgi:xanthine dehydrogenase/oxidase